MQSEKSYTAKAAPITPKLLPTTFRIAFLIAAFVILLFAPPSRTAKTADIPTASAKQPPIVSD